ncbi:DUF2157 domain-containing protein [Inquilinus sp. KBS0705]|nr:DUF2157 domain-containing protein [Inquilinus sp. KBS0705]
MTDTLYDTLHAEGLISDESLDKVIKQQQKPILFSVHWEIKTLLYVGVLTLTTGLGILVYENIETIGHQFVLGLIALICAGCFAYGFKNATPFTPDKVKVTNAFFDYIILLGSISMLIFVGYLQFEYKVFGTNYGLATLIPMLVLFFIAYYFDHIGILNMAIANLAVWMGVSVTPKALLLNSNFDSQTIVYTYLVLGLMLLGAALLTQRYAFKKHFKFSYQHYGLHVTYISLLAGYFNYYESWLAAIWMLGIVALSLVMYSDAFKNRSFYFLLLVVLYSYIALSCVIIRLLSLGENEGLISFIFLYFIASGIGFICFLININKKLKSA